MNAALRWWIRHGAPAVTVAGLLLALTGAYLAASVPETTAYLQGDTVHIDGNLLTARADGVYVGAGALVVTKALDSSIVAGGSASSHGRDIKGRCVQTQPAAELIEESCTFIVGKQDLTSHDTYDLSPSGDHSWHRRYSDGREVHIKVLTIGSVIPVPFPVGR